MKRIPPGTKFIIIANVGIFLLIFLVGFQAEGRLIPIIYGTFGLVPSRFLEGAFWQPLTSMFLHSPSFIFHLLINMIGIWSFGTFLEKSVGTARYLWLYFVSGMSASLLVVLGPYLVGAIAGTTEALERPTVGASGALMGLLGSMAVFYPRSSLLVFFFPVRARTAALVLGVGSLLLAIFDSSSIISHFGHLGGVIGGVLYSKLLLSSIASSPRGRSSSFHSAETVEKRAGAAGGRGVEQIFERFYRSFEQSLPSSSGTTREKIINPRPEDIKNAENSSDAPRRQLIYDPITGRFYYK